jgi:hypothetical protein
MMTNSTVRRTRAHQYAQKHLKLASIYDLCARFGIDVPRVTVSSHIETIRAALRDVKRSAQECGWQPQSRVVTA